MFLRLVSSPVVLGVLLALAVTLDPGSVARAEITKEKPVHHFYNSRLLRPGEVQFSIYGNAKVGVTDTLELGGNGLLLLAGMPNLSVKHEMFKGDRYQTSFSGHLVYASADASEGVDSDDPEASGEEEEGEEDVGGGSTRTTIFPFGITTTYDWDESTFINAGLYDYFVYTKSSDFDASTVFHIITPSLGVDYVLNPSLAFTALTAYPVFMYLELNSDVAEISGFLDFTKLPPEFSPSLTWLTATYSASGSFNMEFGWLLVSGQPAGIIGNYYINLFWRFGGA